MRQPVAEGDAASALTRGLLSYRVPVYQKFPPLANLHSAAGGLKMVDYRWSACLGTLPPFARGVLVCRFRSSVLPLRVVYACT
jgi:hypothetical protein